MTEKKLERQKSDDMFIQHTSLLFISIVTFTFSRTLLLIVSYTRVIDIINSGDEQTARTRGHTQKIPKTLSNERHPEPAAHRSTPNICTYISVCVVVFTLKRPPFPTTPVHPLPVLILYPTAINPFRTAVPFWGQTSQIFSSLSPKRDCGFKGVNNINSQMPGTDYVATDC